VLMDELLAIERVHGRRRGLERFAPRTLDLDLLLFGDRVEEGRLPRPEILQYAFVLRPLADIAPEDRHPVIGKTFRELWVDFAGEKELRTVNCRLDA